MTDHVISAGAAPPVPDGKTLIWTLYPSVRSLGMWLVASYPSGQVEAVAPPGVALSARCVPHEAHQWRHASWISQSLFHASLEPDTYEVLESLTAAMDVMPRNVHEWMAEATERHVQALKRGARLRERDPRSGVAARSQELLHRAASHQAELSEARTVFAADGSMQREFAALLEVASTAHRVAEQLDATPGAPSVLETLEGLSTNVLTAMEEMRPIRDQLVFYRREYQEAMASRSWQVTRPLRRLARSARAVRSRGKRLAGATATLIVLGLVVLSATAWSERGREQRALAEIQSARAAFFRADRVDEVRSGSRGSGSASSQSSSAPSDGSSSSASASSMPGSGVPSGTSVS